VIPGLLERRDRLMLTGEEGLGKSYLLRQIAVMAAAGLDPFDHRQDQARLAC
jgi:RecA-family ATPase